jgi:hypothetical protein
MISHKLKYIFIHIPKTGGNSLHNFLKDSSDNPILIGKNSWGSKDKVEVFKEECVNHPKDWDIKHVGIHYYYRYYNDKLVNNYIKFSIIRNPYDRAISFYFFKKEQHSDFNKKEFISFLTTAQLFNPPKQIQNLYALQKNQVDYLMFKGKMSMDYIVKLENLKEDLNKIPFIKEMNLDSYPHINSSKRSHYRDYYDNETKSLVEKIYKKDFDYFNYKF